jgi:hypothetical protein
MAAIGRRLLQVEGRAVATPWGFGAPVTKGLMIAGADLTPAERAAGSHKPDNGGHRIETLTRLTLTRLTHRTLAAT